MTSNQRLPREVRVSMPETEAERGLWHFIREQTEKLKSALHEAEKQEGNSSPKAKPLIPRVPSVLLGIKMDFEKYFEPRLVALGPLHHGNPKYEKAKLSKLKLAGLFVRDSQTTDYALFLRIKEEIEDLKKCYNQENIQDYDDEKLAWMFFEDGCAVLYAIHYGLEGEFDKLNIKADRLVLAQVDLLLLENQLPYKVLKILIGSAREPRKWEKSITKFIGENLITNTRSGQESQHTEGRPEEGQDYTHLLQRLRTKSLTGEKERSVRKYLNVD